MSGRKKYSGGVVCLPCGLFRNDFFFLELTCWVQALGLTMVGHVSHSRQVKGSALVGFGS